MSDTTRCPKHKTRYGYIGMCIQCLAESHRRFLKGLLK